MCIYNYIAVPKFQCILGTSLSSQSPQQHTIPTSNITNGNNHRTINPTLHDHEAPHHRHPLPNLPLHHHHARRTLRQIRSPPRQCRRRIQLRSQMDREPRLRKSHICQQMLSAIEKSPNEIIPGRIRNAFYRLIWPPPFPQNQKQPKSIPEQHKLTTNPPPQVINEFLLVHQTNYGWDPVHRIDHFTNNSAGASSEFWKVPALKNQG
jgi:hypothetical protein